MGDLGGLFEIILVFSTMMIYPISLHSYQLNVIKKLFVAKCEEETLSLFKSSKSEIVKNGEPTL